MLKQTSEDFKAFFLLYFTKELIKNSVPMEVLKLKTVLDKNKNNKDFISSNQITKEEISDIIKLKEKKLSLDSKSQNFFKKAMTHKLATKRASFPTKNQMLPVLRIPKPRFPLTFQYLRPTPTNAEIDLEKLNPLVNDSSVKIIECNGPEQKILVRGSMGTKKTNISLTSEELERVINIFSKAAKIPISDGIFRVVVGKLILNAMVSNLITTKFIIEKMNFFPANSANPRFIR